MNYQELIERMRKAVISPFNLGPVADAIESLLAENERLKAELAKYRDALRLAVKLQMSSLFATGFYTIEDYAISGNDPYAATRRAIVRAAAEIGKEMN